MGERAGYRLIAPDWSREPVEQKKGLNALLEPPDGPPKTSAIYRMQWYLGDDPQTIEYITLSLVNRLTDNTRNPVGSGMGALRADLKFDRLWPNFLITLGELNRSPFNSLHEKTTCDINDHGLFTLRVNNWKNWVWEWNNVDWKSDDIGSPIQLLNVTFTEGKSITEGGISFERSRAGFLEAFHIDIEGGDTSAEL